jgi:hypothetical protein
MASDRIKVPGYAQKVFYNDQIEYRNFSPDLVGLQLTSEGSTPLFTMGNFSVTTNLEPKKSKIFTTTKFSNFTTLTDLDTTLQQTLNLLINNAGVILNLDKTDLVNYALFGSLKENIRVALENIITNWPAALYIEKTYAIPPDYLTQTGYTFQNYYYDSITNESTFAVNTNVIKNMFNINYFKNGTTLNTFNETNELRNLTINYASFAILYNNTEYDVLEFTGSTYTINDFLYFKVKGNPFSTTATNGTPIYYIKPNSTKENLFFNGLDNLESYLLNRQTSPKYTALFNFTIKSNLGQILYVSENITWPVSDGYNIDFDTDEYVDYATKLLDISTNYDLTTSNLMIRFLVTESITDFDTTAVHLDPLDQDTSGQKMNKTLNIYGVEYDKLNTFIKGISFANTVSYDKNDNTPDIYLKNIARVLGWGLISSVLENNLLQNYIQPQASTYSGLSVGLTAVEADVELWRRLILNSPWIWKSKGSRKSIEFLFKFIGTPLGLIQFNEYIYLAENKIDIDEFQSILFLNGKDENLLNYPLSPDGYPRPFANTSNLYYQSDGLWYRETGGDNATIDITSGNNPHVGLYDGGYRYINQFRNLIPNFSAVTLSSQTTTTTTNNIFTNYNSGTITGYSGKTYVQISSDDDVDLSNCYVVNSTIILDPKGRQDQTNCGCDIPENLKSLSVCIDKKPPVPYNCKKDIAGFQPITNLNLYYTFNYFQYNIDGTLYTINGNNVYYQSIFVDPACCNIRGSQSVHYNEVTGDGITTPFVLVNSGYICCQNTTGTEADGDCGCLVACKWTINTNIRTIEYPQQSGTKYLVFNTETGQTRTTSYNGCNCIRNYTTPVRITDPYTNEVGYGCQLTQQGLADINQPNSVIVQTYMDRTMGNIKCRQTSTPAATKTFAVVINEPTQVGNTVSNTFFRSTQNQLLGGDYMIMSSPLSASSQSGPQIGYFYGYTPASIPQYGDTVAMSIYTGSTRLNPVTLAFDPTLGHKMYYLISNTEFTNTNFVQQIPNLIDITPNYYSTSMSQTTGYYSSNYPFTYVGNPTYIYMVWDFRESTINNRETFCYEFTNNTRNTTTIYWQDSQGNQQNDTLGAGLTASHCAVFGTAGGNGVTIPPSTTRCTNDADCDAIISGPINNFIALNNSEFYTITSVETLNTILPYPTFNGYPVGNFGSASGVISSSPVTTPVKVRINTAAASALQTGTVQLYRGSTLLETKNFNSGASGAVVITFNPYTFGASDVLKIILT